MPSGKWPHCRMCWQLFPFAGCGALFARRGLEPQPCGVLVFAGNFDFLSADVDPEGWYSPTLLAGGFKVFFISVMYGMLIYGASLVIRMLQKPKI